jgi:hypothetical protein
MIVGFLAAALAKGAASVNELILSPLSFYPNTTSMFCLQLGVCLLTFSLLRRFDEPGSGLKWKAVSKNANLLSRYSLTIYTTHQFILLWPLWLMGSLTGDVERYYMNAVTSSFGLFIAVLLLFGLLGLVSLWDRIGGNTALSGY